MKRMPKILNALLLAGLAVFIQGCTLASKTSSHEQAGASELSFKPIKPERWTLKNGLTVLFYRDAELPLVSGALSVNGGTLLDPPEKNGLIGAMGETMRLGGAGDLDGDALDLVLDKLSAEVSSSAGEEFSGVSFSCLSTDFERVMSLFADVALRPRFEEKRIDLWKKQSLDAIRRRKDDPDTIAGIGLSQILYQGTPYGNVVIDADVQAVNRLDLLKQHRRVMRPNGAYLSIVGDVSREAVEKLVEEKFGAWEPRAEALPPHPPVDVTPSPGIYFVVMPFAQSAVQMGQLGVPRLTPDHFAIDDFNFVFGDYKFGSRLMQHVREDLGLTYSIGGAINPGVVKGVNFIGLKTKSATTNEAIVESLNVLADLQKNEIPQTELEETVRGVANSFVFKFDSPQKAVSRAALIDMLHYPSNYDDIYLPEIRAVTTKDIRTVAQKRWDISKFVILVVGNESAYNSLVQMMQNPPPLLKGFAVKKVQFDQKLVF